MTTVPARRILHLGNILNNGYLNAKFQRRRGWEADSVVIDYRHVQAQPEWEEVRIIDPSLDHFNPDWNTIDLHGYQRVPWFHDVWVADIPKLAAQIKLGKPSGRGGDLLPKDVAAGPATRAGGPVNAAGRRILEKVGLESIARRLIHRARVTSLAVRDKRFGQRLVDEFAAAYPDRTDRLTLSDIAEYAPRSVAHRPLFEIYPLIEAYSLDPIYVMLNNPGQPLVCFEHGTLREFPFEDSARGRLYALALKKAERIVITNADCNRAADRLGLTNYTFIPHPLDEENLFPGESPLRERLYREHQCDFVFLAPARHHWKNCPPGLENSWFKRNDILIRALGRFFRARPSVKALVVFFNWGQEVDLSKQLIAEEGFTDRVRWEPISSRPVMRDYYGAADIVFDQFNDGIGTFGAVVPESLACAKPVLLNYKKELHTWCYPELPPALHASSAEEIERIIAQLLDDRHYRMELGRVGREWFLKHHSSSLVSGRHVDIYLDIAERHGWKWSA